MTIIDQPSLREMAIATHLESERQQERDRQKPSELKYARRVSTLLGLLEQKLSVKTWGLSESFYPIASNQGLVPAYKADDVVISLEYHEGDWLLAVITYCPICQRCTPWRFASATGLGALLREGRECRHWHGEAL